MAGGHKKLYAESVLALNRAASAKSGDSGPYLLPLCLPVSHFAGRPSVGMGTGWKEGMSCEKARSAPTAGADAAVCFVFDCVVGQALKVLLDGGCGATRATSFHARRTLYRGVTCCG